MKEVFDLLEEGKWDAMSVVFVGHAEEAYPPFYNVMKLVY
jgi:hypothetical protein